MGGRVSRDQLAEKQLPVKLLKLQRRFAAWRASRRAGQRIPEALWDDACKLAGTFGLNRTAVALKLDYYSLKKQMEQASEISPAHDSEFNDSSQNNRPTKNSRPKNIRSKNVQLKNSRPKKSSPKASPASVELSASLLPASLPLGSRQCTIELEDTAGARMRICLNGYDAADVVALSQQFCNGVYWSSD